MCLLKKYNQNRQAFLAALSKNDFSTTMGLKCPLKKFDSQWPFPMGIWNDFITIFGKDCHIWNNALRSLLSNVT